MQLYCLVPLTLSVAYFIAYGAALIALMIKNHFKFTKQIILVLVFLFLALALQLASCIITYKDGKEKEGLCDS